jgi:hypothetical protein
VKFFTFGRSAEDEVLPTQEQKGLFLTGYRIGCPVEGDAIPSNIDTSDKEYQRGLAAGTKDFKALPADLKSNGRIRR